MKTINLTKKCILALALLLIPAGNSYLFAEYLYSGTYHDPGVCRDLSTGFESNTLAMDQDVEIDTESIKIGCCLTGSYSHTTKSGTLVYRGSDSFGNRCTIYVTEDFEIYYDITYSSQWGSSTCRVNLRKL